MSLQRSMGRTNSTPTRPLRRHRGYAHSNAPRALCHLGRPRSWSPDADSSPPSSRPPAAARCHHMFSPLTSATVPSYPWRSGHHEPTADMMSHLPPPAPLSEDPAASLDPCAAAGITPTDLAAYFPSPTSDVLLISPPSPTTSSTMSGGGVAGRSLPAT